MIYLRSYRVRQTAENQFIISLPTYFTVNHGMKKGDNIHCYITSKGELIFRPKLKEVAGRIHYKTYTLQFSGTRSFKATIPPPFRDENKLKDKQSLHCWMDSDEVMYKKKKGR